MALVIADRVKETSVTEGVGTLTLSGATFGSFQTFEDAIGDGNVTYYCIENGSNFEIGIGTYSVSGNTLSRDTVLQSTNNDNKISLEAVSTVFCVVPAEKILYTDENGQASIIETPLPLTRTDDGDYWQAYSTDFQTRVVSFFVEEGFDPVWKLGLKTSTTESVQPYYGYISAKNGFVELKGNNLVTLSIDEGTNGGLTFNHRLEEILKLTANNGTISVGTLLLSSDDTTSISNDSISQDVLSVDAGVGHLANLQVWNVGSDEKASVDADGNFSNSGDIYTSDVYLDNIRFSDGSVQSTAALPSTSGYLIDQNAADIVSVSGWAGDYIDSVSGWTENYIDSVSGDLQGQITSNDQDISYISGIAVFASGHNLQTVTDNGAVTDNEITINSNFSAVSGSLSGIDFAQLVEANHPPYAEGRVFYDAENHCVTVYNDESEISLQVGQEEYIRIRNNTGSTIGNGKAVYITGAQGQHVTVDLTTATEELKSEAVGIATHDIENNSFGYITTFGLVRGVNTTAFSEGDELFVSVTDGELTNISPTAPNYKTSVGHVVVAGNNGSILVTPRDHKLGGGDAKTLGNISSSGIAFFEQITNDGDAGILASDPSFFYDSGNERLQIGAGGIRFDDGTTQTTAGGGGGGGNRVYDNISSDFSMSASSDVVFLDTSSGPINVELPTAAGQGGKELLFKLKSGSSSGVLVGSGTQTIDGESYYPINYVNQSIQVISDNSNWLVI